MEKRKKSVWRWLLDHLLASLFGAAFGMILWVASSLTEPRESTSLAARIGRVVKIVGEETIRGWCEGWRRVDEGR